MRAKCVFDYIPMMTKNQPKNRAPPIFYIILVYQPRSYLMKQERNPFLSSQRVASIIAESE